MSTRPIATVCTRDDTPRRKTLLALMALGEAVAAMLQAEERVAALPAPEPDLLLTLAEAARELQEPISTIRTRCQRREIVGEKRGSQWRITRREVDRYRARCRAAGRGLSAAQERGVTR